MPVTHSGTLTDNADISIVVDGSAFVMPVSLSYSQGINAARKASFEVSSLEDALKCRLGAKVVITVGYYPQPEKAESYTNYYNFEGIIRDVSPNANGATIIAYDYISLLQTSTYVDYKEADTVGHDLFVLAADAANIPEIDTGNLLGGCGINATKDMGLSGLMTRKAFVDKCFTNMISVVTDSTKYPDVLNTKYWQYAIRHGKEMDFFELDPSNVSSFPALSVSLDSNNLISITPTIDTQRMVNSLTIKSSSPDFNFTYTDTDSVNQYGVSSKLISLSNSKREEIEVAAFEIVSRFSRPTYKYMVTVTNAQAFCLGDYVEVTLPLMGTQLLPIKGLTTSFTDSTTAMTLGDKELSFTEIIKLIV